jgi:hypothetical protein
MFIYASTRAANQTTSGTANTEVIHYGFTTGAARGAAIQLVNAIGKASLATTISGIALRFKRWPTTASTGTAVAARPRDPLAPAATTVVINDAAAITTGTGVATYQGGVGFGKAGPGLWFAINPDSGIIMSAAGGANGNVDLVSVSGEVSLAFEINAIEHAE